MFDVIDVRSEPSCPMNTEIQLVPNLSHLNICCSTRSKIMIVSGMEKAERAHSHKHIAYIYICMPDASAQSQ